MGFLKSTKGSIISDYFVLMQSAGVLPSGSMVDLALYDNYLELSMSKNQKIQLDYTQINDVYYGTDMRTLEKDKSPIGRAIAGGLLFGGAGAVVGAVSGTKKKQTKSIFSTLIISYVSSSGEEKILQFEDKRMYKGKKISKKIKEFAKIENVTAKL